MTDLQPPSRQALFGASRDSMSIRSRNSWTERFTGTLRRRRKDTGAGVEEDAVGVTLKSLIAAEYNDDADSDGSRKYGPTSKPLDLPKPANAMSFFRRFANKLRMPVPHPAPEPPQSPFTSKEAQREALRGLGLVPKTLSIVEAERDRRLAIIDPPKSASSLGSMSASQQIQADWENRAQISESDARRESSLEPPTTPSRALYPEKLNNPAFGLKSPSQISFAAQDGKTPGGSSGEMSTPDGLLSDTDLTFVTPPLQSEAPRKESGTLPMIAPERVFISTSRPSTPPPPDLLDSDDEIDLNPALLPLPASPSPLWDAAREPSPRRGYGRQLGLDQRDPVNVPLPPSPLPPPTLPLPPRPDEIDLEPWTLSLPLSPLPPTPSSVRPPTPSRSRPVSSTWLSRTPSSNSDGLRISTGTLSPTISISSPESASGSSSPPPRPSATDEGKRKLNVHGLAVRTDGQGMRSFSEMVQVVPDSAGIIASDSGISMSEDGSPFSPSLRRSPSDSPSHNKGTPPKSLLSIWGRAANGGASSLPGSPMSSNQDSTTGRLRMKSSKSSLNGAGARRFSVRETTNDGFRLPINPTIHGPASIMAETRNIEDAESRRLTQLAFMS